MNFYLYLIVYSLFPIIDLKKMNDWDVCRCLHSYNSSRRNENKFSRRNNEKSAIFFFTGLLKILKMIRRLLLFRLYHVTIPHINPNMARITTMVVNSDISGAMAVVLVTPFSTTVALNFETANLTPS